MPIRRTVMDGDELRDSHRTRAGARRQQSQSESHAQGGNSTDDGAQRAVSDRLTEQPENSSRDVDLPEELDEDDCCGICTLLLYKPVRTGCNHTLCRSCMSRWGDVSLTAPMTIVSVDEQARDFDAATGLEAKW